VQYFDYTQAPYRIRNGLARAHRAYWARLGQAGSWWTGGERVAMAAEARHAISREYCRERKAALCPYVVTGEHAHAADTPLPLAAIDAVHRIVTNQQRITGPWGAGLAAVGIKQEAYVELCGVVVAVFSIDEFHRALGLPLERLPVAATGAPSGYSPARLRADTGFVPMLADDVVHGAEADLWVKGRSAKVLRALSAVPDSVRDWLAHAAAQYLSIAGIGNYLRDPGRAIDRLQMALVAGRASAINQCFC